MHNWPSSCCSNTYGHAGYNGCTHPPISMFVVHVPVACDPVAAPCCTTGYPMRVPHEVEVAAGSSPQEALIGGKDDEVHLTVEYLVDPSAESPEVRVTAASNGVTTEWSDTGIAAGYYAKDDVLTVQPGTMVTIAATEAVLRLRWCETICC